MTRVAGVQGGARGGAWDVVLMGLLVGSVAVVFVHASSEDSELRQVLEWLDIALCAFFLVEWAWRGVATGQPGRFAATHSWELLGMVPIVAPLPAGLRVLRLLRLVRILRVFGRLGRTVGVWERIAKESNLHKVALASASVTLVGAFLVWMLERDANPEFQSFPEALWWAVVTVTTVGYGDVTPITAAGRFMAAFLMVTGIGTIALLASSLSSVLVVRREDKHAATAPPAMAGGFVADLQVLAALHESGKLTDNEYAAAKGRLLR